MLDSANLRDQAWIRGEPCAPPCWQQIQPGQTTIPQAYAILDELETVIVIDANDTGILFADVDGEPCCQVLSDDEGVVDALLLQLAPGIVLGDVITRLDEPAFVTGEAHSDSEALLSLVYPKRGLLIGALVEGVNGLLSESSPIISAIMLSEATLARLLALTPPGRLERLPGFQRVHGRRIRSRSLMNQPRAAWRWRSRSRSSSRLISSSAISTSV